MGIGGVISDAFGWRVSLFAAAIPGLILAAVFRYLIRDPRKLDLTAEANSKPRPKLTEVLREIARSRAFLWLMVSSCATSFFGYGKQVWQIIYLMRTHDLSAGTIGVTLGISAGLLGISGVWIGGWLGDRFGSKNPRHYLTASIIGGLITVPVLTIGYATDNTALAVVMLALPPFLTGLGVASTFATIQGLVPPHSRAMAMSIKLLIQTLVGLGLGPLTFGLLSDSLKPLAGEDSVRWVLLCAVPLMLIGVLGDWRASAHMKRELIYYS
jgi:MFS family permease